MENGSHTTIVYEKDRGNRGKARIDIKKVGLERNGSLRAAAAQSSDQF